MAQNLDSDPLTLQHGDALEIDDWEGALQAAGIDRYADVDGVAWCREPERVARRDGPSGPIDVHAGVLDADPLVLVLVALARDDDGDVTESMLCGRPVAHPEGPLVGRNGVLTEAEFDRAVETFADAIRSRGDDVDVA
jgi:hypothetical protein